MKNISGMSYALASSLLVALIGTSAPAAPRPAAPRPADPAPQILEDRRDAFDFAHPQVVARHLRVPWTIAFLPDGSALVPERNAARILRLRPGSPPRVVATVPGVAASNEGGLLGIAVSPRYRTDHYIYAYHTAARGNRIVRFRLDRPRAVQVILTGVAHSDRHDGGAIAFGPDGMLYAAVGDADNRALPQLVFSLNGKVLRMTPTGGVPRDNPFPGSLVYSYGHRNIEGMAWDPHGRLFVSEFGQDAWDEVNRIVPGGDYGWPIVEGRGHNRAYRNPLVVWRPAQASPAGAAISGHTLYVAALRGMRLWQVPLDGRGGVGTPTARLVGRYGRLRGVALGPDGWLWVSTSNRDGRAAPAAADDRVLRFPPTRASVAALSSS
jgi:glucose/arabinose dehydrogenase